MRTYLNGLSAALMAATFLLNFSCSEKVGTAKRESSFNADWYFLRDSVSGVEKPEYDDSQWLAVTLPHDYSIMDLPGDDTEDQIGPFSKNAPGNGNGTAHTLGGTGWYRKTLVLEPSDKNKTVILKFDGVYMESEVWVNGHKAGENKNGYTPFWFDITPLLQAPGQPNTIAVKVANIGANSRWYSGSGIYRNVELLTLNPVHIPVWGVQITTPEVSSESAVVQLDVTSSSKMEVEIKAKLRVTLKDNVGRDAGSSSQDIVIPAQSEVVSSSTITIENPKLWDVDSPSLYTAEISLEVDNERSDQFSQSFGIRSLEFSAEKGFLLNGKPILLKGGCLHHDNGYLGAAAFERAEYRKVELMKANGYNAIRCAHNPFSEAFLNACDELGILVINEFTDMWDKYKNPQDYHRLFREWWKRDLTNFMMRDRNHPSLIMWSIGNEIPKASVAEGVRIGKELVAKVKELDDTRPVTEAIPNFLLHGGWKNSMNYFELLDVAGYNYMRPKYVSDHQEFPSRIMYGSESFPIDAYDYWKDVETLPYVIGDFVWTSMDYLGEVELGNSKYVKPEDVDRRSFQQMDGLPEGINPDLVFDYMAGTPSNWPAIISWCGDLDLMGDKKPQGLYRDVLWDQSALEMNVHEPIPEGLVEDVSLWGWQREWPVWDWTGYEDKPLQVRVFTKATQVRLELNGVAIGEKTLQPEDAYIAVFEVPYQAGQLTAIALENGREKARKTLSTPTEASAIKLTADRNAINADANDLAYVTIEIVDKKGVRISQKEANITISVSGNGYLIGSGNANPRDMSSVNKQKLSTFRGKAQAILRPDGTKGHIAIKVQSGGLITESLTVLTQ